MGSALSKIGVPSSAEMYDAALEGLVGLDEVFIREGRVPPLYTAGVRYKSRPHAVWRHADDVSGVPDESGELWGDCEDLACYRTAELRVTGEDPAARVRTYPTGTHKYHCVIQRGSGTIEDPSLQLGMRVGDMDRYRGHLRDNFGDQATGDESQRRRAECVIGEDTVGTQSLSFDVYNTGKGFAGTLRVPTNVAGKALFATTSDSNSIAEAAAKLLNITKATAATPDVHTVATPEASLSLSAIKDPASLQALLTKLSPELAAKLPPGAAQAAQVLTNPTVVAALKNPVSLLNMTTALARPDIALENLKKVGNVGASAVNAIKSLFGEG